MRKINRISGGDCREAKWSALDHSHNWEQDHFLWLKTILMRNISCMLLWYIQHNQFIRWWAEFHNIVIKCWMFESYWPLLAVFFLFSFWLVILLLLVFLYEDSLCVLNLIVVSVLNLFSWSICVDSVFLRAVCTDSVWTPTIMVVK